MNETSKFILLFVGFLFFSCSTKPNCEIPETITYNDTISTIIETHCFMCHAPQVYKKKGGKIKMHDYSSLKKLAEKGDLTGAINHEKGYIAMPYKKGIKIDTCDRLLIQKWVEQGYLE